MSNPSSSSGGIGIVSLVFTVFLVLKLTEVGPVAAWSWWWVTAPLWGSIVVTFMILVWVSRR